MFLVGELRRTNKGERLLTGKGEACWGHAILISNRRKRILKVREQKGNIWESQTGDNWIVIATNGQIRPDGTAIMGKGIALEAAQRYPRLPADLGRRLKIEGNKVFLFCTYGLITFPTKEEYYKPSSIQLIENGLKTLNNLVLATKLQGEILLPRLGCGNGRLQWRTIRPLCENYLKTDQFIIFSR